MPMLMYLPAVVGVPDSCPVLLLKLAQAGLPEIVKAGVLPSESLAVGVNEYLLPVATVVAGVPDIVTVVAA